MFKVFCEIIGYENKGRYVECVNEFVEVKYKVVIINKGMKNMFEYNKEY